MCRVEKQANTLSFPPPPLREEKYEFLVVFYSQKSLFEKSVTVQYSSGGGGKVLCVCACCLNF